MITEEQIVKFVKDHNVKIDIFTKAMKNDKEQNLELTTSMLKHVHTFDLLSLKMTQQQKDNLQRYWHEIEAVRAWSGHLSAKYQNFDVKQQMDENLFSSAVGSKKF